MKTITLSIILALLFQLHSCSQNRIASWNTDEISSISIEINSQSGQNETLTLSERGEIDKIISFLEGVKFTMITADNRPAGSEHDDWKYHLVFHGIQDQVYLFSVHAFIGKSDYLIHENVLADFNKTIAGLKLF